MLEDVVVDAVDHRVDLVGGDLGVLQARRVACWKRSQYVASTQRPRHSVMPAPTIPTFRIDPASACCGQDEREFYRGPFTGSTPNLLPGASRDGCVRHVPRCTSTRRLHLRDPRLPAWVDTGAGAYGVAVADAHAFIYRRVGDAYGSARCPAHGRVSACSD